jgi:SAM-dependent methyltransferase
VNEFLTANLENWDERAPAHAASPDYRFDRFRDPDYLSHVVAFDRPRLGDLSGQRGVHLQCHIGTDTISLSRLGATMTGLDFSPAALVEARRLAEISGSDVTFVHSELYRAIEVLPRHSFDLVYTGVGALCWLPDIDRWAEVVAELLAPGGRVFLREGHPMLWSLADSRPDGLLVVDFPYFETTEPTKWTEGGTYVQTDAVFTSTTSYNWNHGIGEIVTALLNRGLRLVSLEEHDSVPWQAFPGQMTQDDREEWRMSDRPWRLAASYTLQAVKEG